MPLLSGQITVTQAGTPVKGPENTVGTYFALKAHPDNAGTVWFGNHGGGSVSSETGYPLDPGEAVEVYARTLAILYFDADNDGDAVCWYRVE